FDLPQNSFVELEIYDISGRKVRTVVNKNMEAGSHQVVWDGYDEVGNQAASGVYFYRIQAGKFAAVNKMLLMK
ncbi:T9SS type A sorting domain-containing protein, partial [candidate division KSB1 bacterium]|nr:T9SS type A sorting domain-containing protein [candidate division KSB1 bacterium]NIS27943.1 T9SS type A sorting domain-containing protein [candidate division KSB1 bacterium]NIU25058.1 T9SS type A sorting domain-containing protein [candidate division KSB1 bacterium]NIU90268.1 T9SS type A sorting domain-containing protein [candidate division KSB1 bacterium]NIV96602.1 T9SS type A sorting domain-containing protein [candidate division KSB1 bacterium]